MYKLLNLSFQNLPATAKRTIFIHKGNFKNSNTKCFSKAPYCKRRYFCRGNLKI